MVLIATNVMEMGHCNPNIARHTKVICVFKVRIKEAAVEAETTRNPTMKDPGLCSSERKRQFNLMLKLYTRCRTILETLLFEIGLRCSIEPINFQRRVLA